MIEVKLTGYQSLTLAVRLKWIHVPARQQEQDGLWTRKGMEYRETKGRGIEVRLKLAPEEEHLPP